MKPIAVILSGCGVGDGSEIHEAVLTLLALDEAGVPYQCLAPNIPQAKVQDHFHNKAMSETRNVLVESARIARGNIKDVADVNPEAFAGAILPGGFGAALNLCNYGQAGDHCQADPGVAKFLQALHKAGKPIGAICIAPVVVARVLGKNGMPRVTVGTSTADAAKIDAMGAQHVPCPVAEMVIDAEQRIVTTPAYMLAKSIAEAAVGIRKLVNEVVRMAKNT